MQVCTVRFRCICWWQASWLTAFSLSATSRIFNCRPLQAKYMFVWNVQVLLNYIKSKGDALAPCQTKKTLNVMHTIWPLLFCLLFFGLSNLHCLDIRYLVNTGDNVTCHFHKKHKSWRKDNATPWLTIYSHSTDKELCVVKTLNRNLKVTEERWEGKTQLLLSFKKAYRKIVSSTVSGCIKTILN